MFPSGLSMLWESVDPGVAFRDRFGFTSFEDGSAWLTQTLDERWGLTVRGCERILISDQNAIAWLEVAEGRPRLICKWSRAEASFAKLAATADLIRALGERDIPVAAPILSRVGAAREIVAGPSGPQSVAVLPAIEGTPLDVRDGAAVQAAGSELARLHGALAELSDSPARLVAAGPQLDIHARFAAWGAGSGSSHGFDESLRRDLAILPPLDALPQLIHNDYRAANLVTSGSRIAAILDFDELAWDFRVSDLAHAAVYLSTLFRDWGPTSPAARHLFVEGYESVCPLSAAERAWYDFFTRWYSLAAGWAD